MGADISMPSTFYMPGDTCWVDMLLCNMDDAALTDIPTFFVLDIYGNYWFWPSWSVALDYAILDVEPGLTQMNIIAEFIWPDYPSGATGVLFYAAMLNEEMTQVIGSIGMFEFGWGYN